MATRDKAGGGLLRVAERAGLRKGMAGSKGWVYVGSGLWTLRTVRRMAERKPEILVSETLKPGQRMIIANGRVTLDDGEAPTAAGPAKPGRRGRKADAKASAKAAKRAKA